LREPPLGLLEGQKALLPFDGRDDGLVGPGVEFRTPDIEPRR
jgi:hypothetical protein